jgi:hypothetical protein
VLVAVSRRNELFFSSDIKRISVIEGKFAMARRRRQTRERVRYPGKIRSQPGNRLVILDMEKNVCAC